MANAPTPLPPSGQHILHYEIAGVLGTGGMGAVYQATDLRLRRPVALKFLSNWSTVSDDRKERFEREAIAVAKLDHPNIASIYAVERDPSGQMFLVLPCCEGGSLQDRMRRRRMSPEESLSIAISAARGLAHAHARGIVHRDIKPSNLMFTRDSELRIIDFGLARLTGEGRLTDSDAVAGTAPYMSPEQATGAEPDHRADLWALGVVLYELVCGERPFQGDTVPAVLYAIVHRDPTYPAGLPPEVERILRHALAKDLTRRYNSAAEMLHDLEAARRALQAVTLSSTAEMQPAVKGASRRKLAGSAVAAVLGIAAAVWLWNHAPAGARPVRTVVVMDFEAPAGDAGMQAVSIGLGRWLSESLALLERGNRQLEIVQQRHLVSQRIETPSAARQMFGASHAIRGSVAKAADKWTATIHLLAASDGSVLNAASAEAPANDPVKLHAELLRAAVRLLELNARPESADAVSKLRTESSAAAEAYLAGWGYLDRFDKGYNLSLAIQNFREAVRLAPKFVLGHVGLSRAYRQQYRSTHDPAALEQAGSSAAAAFALNPALPEVLIERAAVRNTKGDSKGAVEDLERAMALDSANPDVISGLAQAYDSMSLTGKAEETLRKAIQARPYAWANYNLLGTMLLRRGRFADAVAVLKKLTTVTPDNYFAYTNLGNAYSELMRNAEAERAYLQAIELKPNFAAYTNLGNLYRRLNQYDKAIGMYTKALGIQANHHRTWANLAGVYARMPGRNSEAEHAWRQAEHHCRNMLQSAPDDPSLISNLGLYSAFAGKRAESLQLLRHALALGSDDVHVLMNVGEAYEALGHREEALQWLGRAVELGYAVQNIESSPVLQDLRRDPRWKPKPPKR